MSAVPVPAPRIAGGTILEATGITKKFGGLAAVDGVDLAIRRGEILGVLGPNGAGKTTFVNCMTGLDKPTSGTILFDGPDITKTPSFRIGHLGMARTFQVVKPLRQLTVRENVATGAMFGARGDERTAAQARAYADDVLDRVALADKRDRTATSSSITGGRSPRGTRKRSSRAPPSSRPTSASDSPNVPRPPRTKARPSFRPKSSARRRLSPRAVRFSR